MIRALHEEFVRMLPKWERLRDVCAGEVGRYLLPPNPEDKSAANRLRFEQYKARAVYYNATGRTLKGMVGMAFAKLPTLNTALDFMAQNADGAGNSVYQMAQRSLAEVLKFGRAALYADYPATNGEVSKAEQAQAGIRARLVQVDPRDVINWRVEMRGGERSLVLVVIRERAEVALNGFESEVRERHRVLSLDEVYRVRLYDENDRLIEERVPTDGAGNPWRFIPFTFIGAQNNDAGADEPPLADMAVLNLAHYRNSADYEDSVFFSGQPQFWISGLDEQWRDFLEKNGLYVGSRTPFLLPEGGACGFAQAAPNTLAFEAMTQKEKQMVALGARLMEGGQAKTATQVASEDAVSHSVLSLAASNVNDAYTLALGWAAQYENVADEPLFAISLEFTRAQIDPAMLSALVSAWQAGAIPQSQLLFNLRKFEAVDPELSDEDVKAELHNEAPALGLDDESGTGAATGRSA